ncbi:MAG: TIGR00296 family protein [Thermoprotei archaeon]|nr:MAG: TIGR00296 family protein [Thermoprotei archaeon]
MLVAGFKLEEYLRLEELTDDDGVLLVKLARRTVEHYLVRGERLKPPSEVPKRLWKKAGVFVTIERVVRRGTELAKMLRGCIGYPEPIHPLVKAMMDVAIEAAIGDPRFMPMIPSELDEVIFEVSVLSKPELIRTEKPKDRVEEVVVGRDGLMVRRPPFYGGLLLPQVAVEYGWDAETFLAECCIKAGLPPDAWLDEDTLVYRFQAVIFCEVEPKGRIIRRDLMKELKERRQ